MKKTILIFLIFLIHFSLNAQTIELNDQPDQFVEIKTVNYLYSGRWLLGGRRYSEDGGAIYLSRVDTSGGVTRNIHPNSNIQSIKKIVERSGHAYGFIDGNNQYLTRVTSFNSVSYSYLYDIEDNEYVNDFDVLPNGNLVVVGYRIIDGEQTALLKIFKPFFSLDFEEYYTPGYYSDIIVNSDTSFIVTGGFENNPIVGGRKFNKYYEVQEDILESLESDRIYEFGDGGYILLKDQELTKVDSNYQVLASASYPSFGEIIDMEVDDENGFLLFQKEGEAAMVLKINSSLEMENSFSIEDELIVVNDLDLSDDKMGIGGYAIPTVPINGDSFMYPSTTGYFKTYSKNGITEDKEIDLEIVDVKIADHEIIPECDQLNYSSTYTLNLKNIKVTLVNKGLTTINRATIMLEAPGIEHCATASFDTKYYYQKQDLTILRLEPGDTIEWRIEPFEIPKKTSDTSEIELCIWTTSVENHRDQNLDNNYFCGNVVLGKNEYEETPIIEPTKGEYLIFPNPVGDKMTVSLLRRPYEPTVIEFFDYLGRELEQKYFIAARASYKEFDMTALPPGLYYMRISNDLFEEMTRIYKE